MSSICEQYDLVLVNYKCVFCIVHKFSGQIPMFRTLHIIPDPVDTQTYNLSQAHYNTPTGFKEYITCYLQFTSQIY